MDDNVQHKSVKNTEANSPVTSVALDLEKLKQELDRIIFQAKETMVVAVTGPWGEGKTYFWKKNIAQAYPPERLGYVSVFGADSIKEIRERVVFEALKKPRWHKLLLFSKALSKFRACTKRLGKFGNFLEWLRLKVSQMFLRWPEFIKVIFAPNRLAMQIVEDNVLKAGWILCLDDIERLSSDVNMDALMGYISELRDERQIKVVLIYNRNEMADHKSAFEVLQEKVIDRELPFIPKVRDNLELVFSDTKIVSNDSGLIKELERRCEVLALKNIRLLTRMKHYYEEVQDVLPKDANNEFIKSALFSLLLFTWVRFSKERNSLLTLDYLVQFNSYTHLINRNNTDPEEIKVIDLLRRFGYSSSDDLDRLLIDFVRVDVLDHKLLSEEHLAYQSNADIRLKKERLHKVWKQYYHGTLRNNEDEFCSQLITSTKENIDVVEVHNFDDTLCILNSLDKGDEAKKLLEEFISSRGDDLTDANKRHLHRSIKYPDFSLAWDEAIEQAAIDERSIDEVIESMITSDRLPEEDQDRLFQHTVEELVAYFTSSNKENLTSIIRRLNELSGYSDGGEKYPIKLMEVIEAIADKCTLNRLRMESMGLIRNQVDEQ